MRLEKYVGGAPDDEPDPKGRNEASGASLRGVLEAFLRIMRFRGYVVIAEPGRRGLNSRLRLFEDRSSLIVCREATSIVVDWDLRDGMEGRVALD